MNDKRDCIRTCGARDNLPDGRLDISMNYVDEYPNILCQTQNKASF
jgi:hypothetical protein